MKKRVQILLFTLFFTVGCYIPTDTACVEAASSNSNESSASIEGEYRDGTVIVTLASPQKTSLSKKGKSSFDKKINIKETYDFGSAENLGHTTSQKEFLNDKELYVSEVNSDTYSTEELIDSLENKAYVVSVEPNYIQHLTSTDDTYSNEQWYLDNDGNYGGTSKGVSYSSTKDKTSLETPVVCVVDTGINYEHEDLAEHMWVNPSTNLGGTYGYNFADDTTNCSDPDGHGTHCAGVIAATQDNQTGIAGISDAKLMALRIMDDDGNSDNATILNAFNYIYKAKQEGINITAVNCSWGGGESDTSMCNIVNQLGQMGVVFIFASGNDGTNHDTIKAKDEQCPYDLYNSPYSDNRNYMIITGASTTTDTAAGFSDYGMTDVDLFAPGERIFSTYNQDNYIAGCYDDTTETALTDTLLSFDTSADTEKIHTATDLGLSNSSSTSLSYSSDIDTRDQSDSGSIYYYSRRNKSANLYVEIKDENFDANSTCYLSMQAYTSSDGISIWQHYVFESDANANLIYTDSDGKNYFVINNVPSKMYLDDIGVSVANPDTSKFGQYELMNGTSMAAPMVTGGTALISSLYPLDTAAERRNRVLSCVRTSSSLTGKCQTGGILDLSNVEQSTTTPIAITNTTETDSNSSYSSAVTSDSSPAGAAVTSDTASATNTKVKIKKIKIKKAKSKLKAGKKMKLNVVITPKNATNKKVVWSSSKKKWLSVSKKGVIRAKKKGVGHTVKITVRAKDGSKKKASCKIKIKR